MISNSIIPFQNFFDYTRPNTSDRGWLIDQTVKANQSNATKERRYYTKWQQRQLESGRKVGQTQRMFAPPAASTQFTPKPADLSKSMPKQNEQFQRLMAEGQRAEAATPERFQKDNTRAGGKRSPHTYHEVPRTAPSPKTTALSDQARQDVTGGKTPLDPTNFKKTGYTLQDTNVRNYDSLPESMKRGYLGFTSKEAYEKATKTARDEDSKAEKRKERRMTNAYGNPYAKLVPARAMGGRQIP
jgi:hypothetical protein